MAFKMKKFSGWKEEAEKTLGTEGTVKRGKFELGMDSPDPKYPGTDDYSQYGEKHGEPGPKVPPFKKNGNDDKSKRKVTKTESTSVEEGGDKYYTYKTNAYDYAGNRVKVTEENTSKVKLDKEGWEYSTVLEDQGKLKKGDKVYWQKPPTSQIGKYEYNKER